MLELCTKNNKKATATIAATTAPATMGLVHNARTKGFILSTLLTRVGLLPVGGPTQIIDHVAVKAPSGGTRERHVFSAQEHRRPAAGRHRQW